MKLKLLAAAVAATLITPQAYAAEGDKDVVLYGRINNSIRTDDIGGVTTTDIFNVYSRFGIKASSDLGNGLTAYGRYEFSTFTEAEGQSGSGFLTGDGGVDDTRLGYVGLSGGFGDIRIGQMWSAFYDTVGTHIDPTFISAYFLYSSLVGGPYRVSNNIKYSNSFGPVSMELDVRLADSKDGQRGGDSNLNVEKIGGQDGVGIGFSYNAGPVVIAAAFDNEDGTPDAETGVVSPDVERTGLSGKVSFGDSYVLLGTQKTSEGASERTQTQFHFGHSFTSKFSGIVGYGLGDLGTGAPDDVKALTAGLYYNMGSGFRLWWETVDISDSAGAGNGDFTANIFGMRYDF